MHYRHSHVSVAQTDKACYRDVASQSTQASGQVGGYMKLNTVEANIGLLEMGEVTVCRIESSIYYQFLAVELILGCDGFFWKVFFSITKAILIYHLLC